jgi:hypothetical protein
MRHGQESGFALLLVFLMAAVVAISLYMEIPRIAFETQRQKEQLLVERGEQYKRAIKLFVGPHGMGRWPAKIEDLENTNNRRFLRHRFVDPFTGKDDWRLVHIMNGVLTDSVLTKPKTDGDQKDASAAVQSSVGTLSSVGALAGVTGLSSNPLQNLNAALRRRASEGGANPTTDGQPGSGGTPGGVAGTGPDGQPYPGAPPYPGTPTYPGTPPSGTPPYPSTPSYPGTIPYPGASPSQGGGYGSGSQPGSMGSTMPGYQPGSYPGMPGPPVNSQTGGVSPYPTLPGSQNPSPNFPQPGLPGSNPSAQQTTAAAIINQILMSPNPRGVAGLGGMQGAMMGGGIAGVASKTEGDSIMVVNDRSKYNEWEFVYDITKDKPLPNPNTSGGVGRPASQLGSQPTTTPAGTSPFGPATPGNFTPNPTGQNPAGQIPTPPLPGSNQ